MILKVKKLDKKAILPTYGTEGAACFDISTIDSGTVEAGGSKVFGTGLAFEVPYGYVLKVYSRSGHGFNKDIRLANCVGIIDSDFRGEVKVKLTADGEQDYQVNEGDRIAQGMLIKFDKVVFEEVDDLSTTERGEGGMGSTGVSAKLPEEPAEIVTIYKSYYEACYAASNISERLKGDYIVHHDLTKGVYRVVEFKSDSSIKGA